MIFGFFKRSPPPPAAKPKPKAKRKAQPDTTVPMLPAEPSALHVTEGDDHESWSLWEDSVAAMDSQLGSVHGGTRPQRRIAEDEVPTEFQDVEAFARVRNKDP